MRFNLCSITFPCLIDFTFLKDASIVLSQNITIVPKCLKCSKNEQNVLNCPEVSKIFDFVRNYLNCPKMSKNKQNVWIAPSCQNCQKHSIKLSLINTMSKLSQNVKNVQFVRIDNCVQIVRICENWFVKPSKLPIFENIKIVWIVKNGQVVQNSARKCNFQNLVCV